MPNMDSMESGWNKAVDQITINDIKEGDMIEIVTESGTMYSMVYTAGILIVRRLGRADKLANAIGNFNGVHKGESLNFGAHRTSRIKSLFHIRPNKPGFDFKDLPSESIDTLRVAQRAQLKIGMAGKDGVSLTAEESRALCELYGIAQFSPDQKE